MSRLIASPLSSQQKRGQLSRIQFFSSETSFAESTFSESRLMHGERQVYQETQLIFLSLQRQLQLIDTPQMQQRIGMIMKRASNLYRFIIPELVQDANKMQIDLGQLVTSYVQRIHNLVEDYERLMNGSVAYRQFYEKYSNCKEAEQKSTNKKQQNNQQIRFGFTEQIIINQKASRSHLKNMNTLSQANITPFPKLKDAQSYSSLLDRIYELQQENKNLTEQIHLLKRRLNDNQKSHCQEMEMSKKLFSERITKVISIKIKMLQNLSHLSKDVEQQHLQSQVNPINTLDNSLSIVLRQLRQISLNLTQQISKNSQKDQKLNELGRQMDRLKQQNSSLKQQIDRSEKLVNQSYLESTTNDKANSKRNQVLLTEITLLKKELQNQRQKNYKQTLLFNHDKNHEINRIKETLQKKNKEIQQLLFKIDQIQTEKVVDLQKLKLSQENHQKSQVKIEQYKDNIHNQRLSNSPKTSQYSKTDPSFYTAKSQQLLAYSRMNNDQVGPPISNYQKVKASAYASDVLEGFVYFKCLEKEFRYRYLRSCLKEKQLLYKKGGFEVGVVTKAQDGMYNQASHINFSIFLTNNGQETLNDIGLSVMNSNTRNQLKFQNSTNKYKMQSGQQIKINISLSVCHYPIGSLVLCISGFKDQIRLILPANIVKLFKFQEAPLDQLDMKSNTSKIKIKYQKKVCKTFSTLIEYLTGQSLNLKQISSIGLRAFNQQTGTKVKIFLSYDCQQQEVEIFYVKQAGNLQITDYLIKNIGFLIEKEKK